MEEQQFTEDMSDMSLGELFAIADKIGSKYQTEEERQEFQRKFAELIDAATDSIDRFDSVLEKESLEWGSVPNPFLSSFDIDAFISEVESSVQ